MTAPIAHLEGRLTPAARAFLDTVARESGVSWGRAYARLFVGGIRGSHVTHLAHEDQPSIEGSLVFVWRPGEPGESRRFGGRR